MSDHSKHDVSDLVAKHLKALYEEAEKGGSCDLCVTHSIAMSAVGTVLEHTQSTDDTKSFLQSVFGLALRCHLSGHVAHLDADERKKRMN
jgi:hypothetical protein